MTFRLQAAESPSEAYGIRTADPADILGIVRVTNRAYAVEAFCLQGDRTDEVDVTSRMREGGFLVIDDPGAPSSFRGSVFWSSAQGRGYLGTLAVEPSCQGRGLAQALVKAVEEACRAAECHTLDLTVVNLRQELFPFYAKLGFKPSGVLPFPRPEKILRPLHLVQMTKDLKAPGAGPGPFATQ